MNKLQYKKFSSESYPIIHATFREAFSDYGVDVSYMTEEVIRNRSIKNGIDFDLSIGAWDGDHLVGFTLVGRDEWNNEVSAFDIMTGIIKPFRGLGIANAMFEKILPVAREKNVRNFVLEVIQDNKPAIKAYEKSGFAISRALNCYGAKPEEIKKHNVNLPNYSIEPVDRSHLETAKSFTDWNPSWENSFNSLNRIPDQLTLLGAFRYNRLLGILAYYPLIKWINLLAVHRSYRGEGVASALLASLLGQLNGSAEELKVINVDGGDERMSAFLLGKGFKPIISQYEMKLSI